jgi:hypothetical protein
MYRHLVCVLHEPAALPGGFAPGSLGHETCKLCGVEVAPNPLTSCLFYAFRPADHSANAAVITVPSALPVVACAVVALGFGSAVAAPSFVLALILLLVAAIPFARWIRLAIGDGPST